MDFTFLLGESLGLTGKFQTVACIHASFGVSSMQVLGLALAPKSQLSGYCHCHFTDGMAGVGACA